MDDCDEAWLFGIGVSLCVADLRAVPVFVRVQRAVPVATVRARVRERIRHVRGQLRARQRNARRQTTRRIAVVTGTNRFESNVDWQYLSRLYAMHSMYRLEVLTNLQ